MSNRLASDKYFQIWPAHKFLIQPNPDTWNNNASGMWCKKEMLSTVPTLSTFPDLRIKKIKDILNVQKRVEVPIPT